LLPQIIFPVRVNKPIQNEDFYQLIRGVFKEKSALNQPVGVLNVKVPLETADFNVSADKTEVKLINEQQLKDFVVKCCRE